MDKHKKSRAPLPYQVLNRLQRGFLRWRCIAYLERNGELMKTLITIYLIGYLITIAWVWKYYAKNEKLSIFIISLVYPLAFIVLLFDIAINRK